MRTAKVSLSGNLRNRTQRHLYGPFIAIPIVMARAVITTAGPAITSSTLVLRCPSLRLRLPRPTLPVNPITPTILGLRQFEKRGIWILLMRAPDHARLTVDSLPAATSALKLRLV